MKRTDLQKRERELKRAKKKEERFDKPGEKSEKSIGDYINELNSLFFHDEKRIYNAKESMEILELLEEMKQNVDETNLDVIIRKAIRKTQVKEREQAFDDLKNLIDG